jgi:hypothetical protein
VRYFTEVGLLKPVKKAALPSSVPARKS